MNKKEKIIHASIKAFREHGIEKTKISDIVKIAGIAQGTFYLYFPSKLSVMPAIAEVMVDKLMNEIKDTVQKDADFSIRVEQLVHAIFHITEKYREIHALIYAGLTSTEHIRKWEKVYEPVYKWVSDLLQEAQSSRDIRSSINIEPTSRLIIGLIESAAEQVYLYDHKDDVHAREQKSEVILFLKHALGIVQ